jgi:oligopeptide/dipeptide ABC transporter ATP-binding protein
LPSPLLRIDDLRVSFHTEGGRVEAVRGVGFEVPAGRTVALLGESGCGKSVTARAALGLVEKPGRVDAGTAVLQTDAGPVDLLALDPDGEPMRRLRWAEVAMIFQDPMNALTPAYTVGEQIAEAVILHERVSKAEARARALGLLREVGIPAAERRLDAYPHQLSGGMSQRVMIAMALACGPRLLVADEPTTALDVTIQAQVLDLLRQIQAERGTSILLITHDLGVVAEMADEVVVMYLGRIAERGPVADVFDRPKHPYTRALLSSVPRPDQPRERPLTSIPGTVPDLFHVPVGCPFRGRCPHEMAVCRETPPLLAVEGQEAACWLHAEPAPADA